MNLARDLADWGQLTEEMSGFDQLFDMMPDYAPHGIVQNAMQQPGTFRGLVSPENGDELSKAACANAPVQQPKAQDRSRMRNNLAQKRHRERRKQQSQELSIQFAETTKQLEELRAKQKSLEARNVLLEKLMHLNQHNQRAELPEQVDEASPQLLDSWGTTVIPAPLNDELEKPLLRISLDGGADRTLRVQDIPTLPLQEIAGTLLLLQVKLRLPQEYVRQIGACLMELQQHEADCSAEQRLQQLSSEINLLIIATAKGSPGKLKKVHQCKMDEGKIYPDHQHSVEYLQGMLKQVDHTPAQIADLLYSRQLYYRKLGQLARDRQALISKMSSGETDMSHVSDKLSGWTEMSEQLRSIGREEYQTYLQACACFYHGIHTTKQFAAALVYAYPWSPPHKAIEVLALDRGEPSIQELMNDTSLDNLQHAANWEEIISYLKSITMDNYHGHVPLVKD